MIVRCYNFWATLELSLFLYLGLTVGHRFGDMFRGHDMGGFAKAMWTIFIMVVPVLGVLRVDLKEGAR